MKITPLALMLICPLALTAQPVQTGATLREVWAALGVPRGQLAAGERQLLHYERGEVELRAGIVTRVNLLSADDLAARDTRRATEAARVREEQEIRRARLTEEGEALKARKLADPDFLATPPEYQVAFWQDFSLRYAEVPSAEQLGMARRRVAAQAASRARQEQADRIAELESRLVDAEMRADDGDQRGRVYVSAGRRPHHRGHGSDLWPVEYRFAGPVSPPSAASVQYPAWGTTPYDLRQKAAAAAAPDKKDSRGRPHHRRARF